MIKVFSYIFTLVLFVFLIFSSPAPALAQSDWNTISPGRCAATVTIRDKQGKTQTFNDVATIQGFECVFYNILQIIVYIAGVIFFFMFIAGGYQYLFSANDPKKTAQASSTLTMAVLGVVGIIASWFILRLISNFTGIQNLTDFVIPGP